MLSDPQNITFNAATVPLLRTGASEDSGAFRSADGTYKLSITHSYGKRIRRTHRLDYKVLAPDVMDSSVNVPYSASVYTVVDLPTVGISRANQGYLWIAQASHLVALSNANLNKILDGES